MLAVAGRMGVSGVLLDGGRANVLQVDRRSRHRPFRRHAAAQGRARRGTTSPAAAGSEAQEPQAPAEAPRDGRRGSRPRYQRKGPARVILVSREAPRTGPSSMHITGEVKNVGGADAQRVAVTISSVDSTAGTPCLSEEAAVTPSTLHPGESGRFDVDVDSPCLCGPAAGRHRAGLGLKGFPPRFSCHSERSRWRAICTRPAFRVRSIRRSPLRTDADRVPQRQRRAGVGA